MAAAASGADGVRLAEVACGGDGDDFWIVERSDGAGRDALVEQVRWKRVIAKRRPQEVRGCQGRPATALVA